MANMPSMANDTGLRADAQRTQATLDRDIAIARVTRVRGASIAGAAALTAGFATLVAGIAPGKTYGATTSADGAGTAIRTADVSAGVLPTMPPLAGASQLGLQAPAAVPSASSGSSGSGSSGSGSSGSGSSGSASSGSASSGSSSSGSASAAPGQQAAAQQAAAQQAAAQQAAVQQAAVQQAAAQQAADQQAAAQPAAGRGGGQVVVSGGS